MTERAVMPGLEDETDGLWCVDCGRWLTPDEHNWHTVSDGADNRPDHTIAPAIEHGVYIVNPLTGEVLALNEGAILEGPPDEPFRVRDAASAEWVLARLMEHESEAAAIRSRIAIITENLTKMAQAQMKRAEFLRWRFSDELEAWARAELEGRKERSVTTPYGKLAFRKTREKVSVIDEDQAVNWCKVFYPDAVNTKESVYLSKLPPGEELPEKVFKVEPAGEDFTISTGVKG